MLHTVDVTLSFIPNESIIKGVVPSVGLYSIPLGKSVHETDKKNVLQKEQKLQKILELEKKLEEIQDIDVLLERILTETRAIVRADAGSIYEIEDNKLRIKYAQNDTQLKKLKPGEKLPYLSFSVPINEKSISGYVALSGEPVNIQNAYRIPSDKPFVFNKKTDIATGYHTKSIYTLPLKMQSGKLLGVMQLINAQNESGKIIGFDRDAVLYITHFASNVRQALQNTYQTNLMVQRMLKMAELRDPKETYPHVMRVAENSLEIYDRWAFDHRVPEHEKHRFRDCLKIAAKFHDIGKVGIPDAVLHSPKRYGPDDENRAILKGHTCIGAQISETVLPCSIRCVETLRSIITKRGTNRLPAIPAISITVRIK